MSVGKAPTPTNGRERTRRRAARYTTTSWLKDHRYLKMDYLKEQKKELMQTAAYPRRDRPPP